MSNHPDPEIRANVALLQNHSEAVHNSIYRMDRQSLAVRQNMAADAAYGGSESENEEENQDDPGEGTSNGKRKVTLTTGKRNATSPQTASNPTKRICMDDLAPEKFGIYTAANGANKVFNDIQMELLRITFQDSKRTLHQIREKAALDPRFAALWAGLIEKRKATKKRHQEHLDGLVFI